MTVTVCNSSTRWCCFPLRPDSMSKSREADHCFALIQPPPLPRWNTTSKRCGFGRGCRSPKLNWHQRFPARVTLYLKTWSQDTVPTKLLPIKTGSISQLASCVGNQFQFHWQDLVAPPFVLALTTAWHWTQCSHYPGSIEFLQSSFAASPVAVLGKENHQSYSVARSKRYPASAHLVSIYGEFVQKGAPLNHQAYLTCSELERF